MKKIAIHANLMPGSGWIALKKRLFQALPAASIVVAGTLITGCANMSVGVSVPLGRNAGVGVSVGSGGQVSGTVGVSAGGGSVSVSTSGQLPKKEEPKKDEEKKP